MPLSRTRRRQLAATASLFALFSFTGSSALAQEAPDALVKRVSQELGGKSPNIILPDADFLRAVTHGTRQCFSNSGQSCNAPTRMLVPADRQEEVIEIARDVARRLIEAQAERQVTVPLDEPGDRFEDPLLVAT